MKQKNFDTPEKTFGLTVRAVIRDAQNRCLLLRRSAQNKRMAGQWEWPGGKMDPGEDFTATLHRELAEETGLTVAITGFVGATEFELADIPLQVIVLCMETEQTGGTLTLSHEHDAAEWVPLSKLSDYHLTDAVHDFMLDYAAKHLIL